MVKLLTDEIHGFDHLEKVAVVLVIFSDEKYMFASF
jgi:hypothetical protein